MGGLVINQKSLSKISLFIILTIIVALFQFVSIRGATTYLEYVALALFAYVFVKSTKFELLCIVMFLLPNNQYINYGSTSIITILVTVYFLRTIVFSKKIINLPLLLLGMLLISYTAFFGNFSSISTAIKTYLYLYFCIDVINEPNYTVKQKYVAGIKFLVIGIIVSSFISVLLKPDVFNMRFSLAHGQSTNTLGILAGYAIGCIFMLIQNENIYIKRSWLITVIPLTAVGFLTQSRSFIFSVLISIIWCSVYAFGKLNNKQSFKFLGLLVGLFILLYFIINSNGQWAEVINNAIERILYPKDADISNGRFNIWYFYINEITQNKFVLFFGKGTSMSSNFSHIAHNLWLEQLYSLGIVGNFVVILMFGVSIKHIYKRMGIKRLSFYGWLPLIMILASSFFSHSFVAGADTIRFFLAVLAVGVFAKIPSLQYEIGSFYKGVDYCEITTNNKCTVIQNR